MTTLVTVPQGGSALDVLAARYRVAFNRTKHGRQEWIEGTLELAVVIADVRVEIPAHGDFSRWVHRNGLDYLSPNDRAALVGFSRDLKAARRMLEKSDSSSWRAIWEKQPKGAPIKNDKGPKRTKHNASGADKRKRRNAIPDAMRDDPPPEPPPVRKAVVLKGLPREEVDPDFEGTALEFATEYGHVNLHTKAQIQDTKRQEVLATWLGAAADLDRSSRAVLVTLADVDPATLRDWIGKPGKAGKLRAWHQNAKTACDALERLGAEARD